MGTLFGSLVTGMIIYACSLRRDYGMGLYIGTDLSERIKKESQLSVYIFGNGF